MKGYGDFFLVAFINGKILLELLWARLNDDQMNAYKAFARPFGKVFLGAVLTYQIIYWIWVKLETDEIKLEKNGKCFQFNLGPAVPGPLLTDRRRSGHIGKEGTGIGSGSEMKIENMKA